MLYEDLWDAGLKSREEMDLDDLVKDEMRCMVRYLSIRLDGWDGMDG